MDDVFVFIASFVLALDLLSGKTVGLGREVGGGGHPQHLVLCDPDPFFLLLSRLAELVNATTVYLILCVGTCNYIVY